MTIPISFALISRFQYCETPFLNEFINYYVDLGVDHFYFVNTEPHNLERIKSHIAAEYLNQITIINRDDTTPFNQLANTALEHIKETFMLHLDLDEFLYLNGKDLRHFISELISPDADSDSHFTRSHFTHQAFTFRWILSPSYKYVYKDSIKNILSDNYFFPSRDCKTMALTKSIETIRDHTCKYKTEIYKKDFNIKDDNIFVFHVSSRGIYDIINKVQFSNLTNIKRSKNPSLELNKLIFNKKYKNLPARFISLAFQSRSQKHIVSINHNFPALRYITDTQLLEKITLEGLQTLLKKKVNKNDIDGIISKVRQFGIPEILVDQYASNEINLLHAIRKSELSNRPWIVRQIHALKSNLKNMLFKTR